MDESGRIEQLAEENQGLREDNRRLREENERLRAQVVDLGQVVVELEAALAQAPKRRPSTPPVKPSTPRAEGEPRPRAKRDPQHNHGRRRALEPTRVVRHSLEACPDCGGKLGAERVAWRREVIDLPPPQPVEVTEHVVVRRWCGVCRKVQTP